MKHIKGYSLRLLTRNIRTLLGFEILFKTFLTLILYPFTLFLLRYSLKWAGLGYVTLGNMKTYLSHISTILVLLLLCFLIIAVSLYDILCITICYEASRHNVHIQFTSLLKIGALRLISLFKPRRLPAFFLAVLLLPVFLFPIVTNIMGGVSYTTFSTSLHIPKTITMIIGIPVILWFILVALFYILFLHNLTIDGIPTYNSIKTTFAYLKRRKSLSIVNILIWLGAIIISAFIVYALIIILAAFIIKLFFSESKEVSAFLATLKYLNIILVFIFSCMIEPLFILIISSMFYHIRKPLHINSIEQNDDNAKALKIKGKKLKVIALVCLAGLLIVNIFIISTYANDSIVDNVEILRIPKVSAHRGSSYEAPENTVAAIKKAIENNSDYAELDVRETKDGQLVLMHDPELKRTTGVNKNVWELDYSEIEQLDAGAWFSDEYIGEPVPLLEDIIKTAKGKIKLNIELKPTTDNDKEFIGKVVDLIEKYNFEDECVITSFDYNLLKEAKKLNTNIHTAVISSMILGNCSLFPYADSVSLNYVYVSKEVVDYMHANGKKVFVWTVNSKESIVRMLGCGVDNIISDNPVLVKQLTYSKNQNIFIKQILKKVFNYKVPKIINNNAKKK